MPIVIDLFCGLGGWSDGFLAEGYDCIGFDIERHDYGTGGYPGQLVIQDVHTIHGKQFKDAACIVASPPCQEFSYMAMPWKRAKQIARALRGDGEFPEGYTGSRTVAQLTALFDACFRIQREASEAAGHHIPLVVENVKGAQPWVGKPQANYGSFYLWGDVRSVGGRIVAAHRVEFGTPAVKAWHGHKKTDNPSVSLGELYRLTGQPYKGRITDRPHDNEDGRKVPMNFHEHEKTGKPGRSFQSAAVEQNRSSHVRDEQQDSSVPELLREHDRARDDGSRGDLRGLPILGAEDARGIPAMASREPSGGNAGQKSVALHAWFNDHKKAGVEIDPADRLSRTGSKSSARKAASAQIAKIPFELSAYVARCFKPT